MALAQSPTHQELLAIAQRVLPGGSNGNVILPPEQAFVIAAGQGTRVYDVEGHCWIDYLLGSGPMILGHAHPEVVAAVQEQLTKGSTFFISTKRPSGWLRLLSTPCRVPNKYALHPRVLRRRFCLAGGTGLSWSGQNPEIRRGFHGSHDYAMMSTEGSNRASCHAPCAARRAFPRVWKTRS